MVQQNRGFATGMPKRSRLVLDGGEWNPAGQIGVADCGIDFGHHCSFATNSNGALHTVSARYLFVCAQTHVAVLFNGRHRAREPKPRAKQVDEAAHRRPCLMPVLNPACRNVAPMSAMGRPGLSLLAAKRWWSSRCLWAEPSRRATQTRREQSKVSNCPRARQMLVKRTSVLHLLLRSTQALITQILPTRPVSGTDGFFGALVWWRTVGRR